MRFFLCPDFRNYCGFASPEACTVEERRRRGSFALDLGASSSWETVFQRLAFQGPAVVTSSQAVLDWDLGA